MKLKIEDKPVGFIPKEITIKIDDAIEYNLLKALFSYANIERLAEAVFEESDLLKAHYFGKYWLNLGIKEKRELLIKYLTDIREEYKNIDSIIF